MKKTVSILLCLITVISLCSCDVYEEADMQYAVTCIGFDKSRDTINATVEMLAFDHKSKDEESKTMVVTASGNSPHEALENINSKLSKRMYLGHCGVIVLGKTLTKNDNKKILLYCNKNGGINSAVYVVTSNSANKLLNIPPNAEISVGYEIMGIISCEKTEKGIVYNNRLYQIDYKRIGATGVFTLPDFTAEQDTCHINGITVYADAEKTAELDRKEAFAYYLLTGNIRSGTSFLSNGTRVKTQKVKRNFSGSYNGTFQMKINITVDCKTKENPKEEWLCSCENLYNKSKTEYKTDIFGFSDEIKNKNAKLWKKLKKNYTEKYGSSDLEIKFKVVKK